MPKIIFVDTETDTNRTRLLDIGAIDESDNSFHKSSLSEFERYLKGSDFICGHNIIHHDLKFIKKSIETAGIDFSNIIDTLYLSPLLFPKHPYHSLVKDDKLQPEDFNNPLNDAIQARTLFHEELAAFHALSKNLQSIYRGLLNDQLEFKGFFRFLNIETLTTELPTLIASSLSGKICIGADLSKWINQHPIELAYTISLIECDNRYSVIPPWVQKNFPQVDQIFKRLRSTPCLTGCEYCNNSLNIHKSLKKYFGFDQFRSYQEKPLQEDAVQAAVDGKSLVCVFPTGGGKSLTFQLPALMNGDAVKGLTVVISPLQSLMKDQVDNLEKQGITESVTINGLLDPIERSKSFERVADGSASILYISPESLRSRSIENLLLSRNVVRFVIDEAHCFSSWGQDFRVDYQYIGEFIKNLQVLRNAEFPVPVSCFTATAKLKVIEDICDYFKKSLSVELERFTSSGSRTNLEYKVFNQEDENEKFRTARELIEIKQVPTILYVSRTKKAFQLAERLKESGINALPYHGKMEATEKIQNQNAFIQGEADVIVATSAFGMGVDKKDVGMVIHYEISDSLENYVQEAGRAGRDENITADCYVLFNEEDLSKHFILLNQTKLSIKEIQQVWKAVKDLTRFRSTLSNSALEIARTAGWDDNVADIETRVTTAIAALENSDYLKRKQNAPRIFATGILAKNAEEAISKIQQSPKFAEEIKQDSVRVIKKLLSARNRKRANDEEAESRVDYISDHLGIPNKRVLEIVSLLKEEKILADSYDLSAYINQGDTQNRSDNILTSFIAIENFLLRFVEETEKEIHLKEITDAATKAGIKDLSPQRLKTILNFWAIRNYVRKSAAAFNQSHIRIMALESCESLKNKIERRVAISRFIISWLFQKYANSQNKDPNQKDQVLVEFSVHELKDVYNSQGDMFIVPIKVTDVEESLFYLSRIGALSIDGGFLVLYNRLTIERIELDNRIKYKNEDYEYLKQFYENRVEQIHIVGEYAKRMLENYKTALQFVDDYFNLNYDSFLNKYFPGRKGEIKRNITPAKFRQLFAALSPAQLSIINDKESKYIAVLAGPGSGKTRILVHKLAALLLMEDVKHEQLLMVTFSRAAATEFKKRLIELIGNAALFIEIKTFHSYCFDILGKLGTLSESDEVINLATEKIVNGEIEINRITKTVLVIDEAQDISAPELKLINSLMDRNEEMRVIVVGDDDQNIYEFRGSDSKYLEDFIRQRKATPYPLLENYRSKSNLVAFTNGFLSLLSKRLKRLPVLASQSDTGRIYLNKYSKGNLIVAVAEDIQRKSLAGTVAVLTRSNFEAVQIAGHLNSVGVKARLIQDNSTFNLYNLVEVRDFLESIKRDSQSYSIGEDDWKEAVNVFRKQHSGNPNLELVLNILNDFSLTNPKIKYLSDLEIFIRESKMEDFYRSSSEVVLVSTMHKAKGKEFDNVFILVDDKSYSSDSDKRLLYVALTRAKKNLFIHTSNIIFDSNEVEDLSIITHTKAFGNPDKITVQLTYKDIWLGYSNHLQPVIKAIRSGDELSLNDDGCCNSSNKWVLKFSKAFKSTMQDYRDKGFVPVNAKVNFVIFYRNEDLENEIRIVLPEVVFGRIGG